MCLADNPISPGRIHQAVFINRALPGPAEPGGRANLQPGPGPPAGQQHARLMMKRKHPCLSDLGSPPASDTPSDDCCQGSRVKQGLRGLAAAYHYAATQDLRLPLVLEHHVFSLILSRLATLPYQLLPHLSHFPFPCLPLHRAELPLFPNPTLPPFVPGRTGCPSRRKKG